MRIGSKTSYNNRVNHKWAKWNKMRNTLSLNLTQLQQEQKMGALKNKMAVWSKCGEQF